MPETPEELYARVADALVMPAVETWDTFPFSGEMRPRPLEAPSSEPPRSGAGGVDCKACEAPDSAFLWTDEHWRLRPFDAPSGLPLMLLLQPRIHLGEPGELP